MTYRETLLIQPIPTKGKTMSLPVIKHSEVQTISRVEALVEGTLILALMPEATHVAYWSNDVCDERRLALGTSEEDALAEGQAIAAGWHITTGHITVLELI